MFLTARNTLKLGHTKFLYPACSTIRLLFCTFFCVFALSICLQCGGKAMFGAPVVSPSASACNAEETYSFTWDNEDLSFTMRSEETDCCGFPNVSSSRIAGCEIAPLRNITWLTRLQMSQCQWACIMILKCFATLEFRQACCCQKNALLDWSAFGYCLV